jgi:glycerophosphoryl diester phosphodiesterase
VLQKFGDYRINIELKELGSGIEQKIFDLIEKYDMDEKVLVAALKDVCSKALRRFSSNIARSASYKEVRFFFILLCLRATFLYHAKVDSFQVSEYLGRIHLVTPRFIQEAHKMNIKVHVWTVNEQQDMERLLDWGADGIITDFPQRLKMVLEKHCKSEV